MDWIMTLEPRIQAALIGLIVIAIIAAGKLIQLFVRGVRNAIEKQSIQLDEMRSELKMREDAQKAQRERDNRMFGLLEEGNKAAREQADAFNRAIISFREEMKAARESEHENQKHRNQSYDNNTKAIIQLSDALETQAARNQQTDIILQDVASKSQKADKTLISFEARLNTVLEEIRTTVNEYNESYDAHTVSANERHNAVMEKIVEVEKTTSEILTLLKPPPPKPPNEITFNGDKSPKDVNKTDNDNEEKEDIA